MHEFIASDPVKRIQYVNYLMFHCKEHLILLILSTTKIGIQEILMKPQYLNQSTFKIYIYTSRYKKKSLELNSYEFVITEIFNQRIAEAKAEMQDKKAGKKNKGLLKILMP